MYKLDKPFPFFLNNDRGNFLLIVAVSVFTYTFMELFKPFGEDTAVRDEVVVYSVITFMVMSFNILILPRLASKYLDNCGWTLRKYIWFNLYNLVAISLMITLSHYITRTAAECPSFLVMIYEDLWKTAAIGIFPLVGITFALENRMLAQALKVGNEATSQLMAYREKGWEENDNVVTVQSETKETLDIELSSFLYAHAENNYSELFWINDVGGVERKLMRLSLKNLEEQIGSDHVLRCHRSYVVNLFKVDSVTGNANGYRLHITGAAEGIPVSRTQGKDILEKINEMSVSVA